MRKSNPIKTFFAGLALLTVMGLVGLLLWLIAFGVLAALLYLGLSLFTDWSFIARVATSILASFTILKVLGLLSDAFDLLPEWWFDPKLKPTPCPRCGKNLRTAFAQQCRHCGADWHSKSPRYERFRTVVVVALAIFASVVGSVVLSVAAFFWHITPSVHEFPVDDPDVQLTEDVAIEYTRKALVLDGKGSPDMHPYKWEGSSRIDYFAHSESDPNSGKVLWETNNRRGWDFSVNIEKTESEITCSIYRPK